MFVLILVCFPSTESLGLADMGGGRLLSSLVQICVEL